MSDERVDRVFGAGSSGGSRFALRHGAARRREEASQSSQQRREQLLRQKRFHVTPMRMTESTASMTRATPATHVDMTGNGSEHVDVQGANEDDVLNAQCAEAVVPAVTSLRAAMQETALFGKAGFAGEEDFLLSAAVTPVPANVAPVLLSSARALRGALSGCPNPPCEAAVSAGAVPLLVRLLGVDSVALATESAWCLTNITAADYMDASNEAREMVRRAIASAVPHLVLRLAAVTAALPSAPVAALQLAEQCAWALGNAAGDCQELREAVVKAGAPPHLALLTTFACRAGTSGQGFALELDAGADGRGSVISTVIQTSAWALSNVLRSNERGEVGQVVDMESIAARLMCCLVGPMSISTEVSWILTYCTARDVAHVNLLLDVGLAEAMATVMARPVVITDMTTVAAAGETPGVAGGETLGKAQLTPLIRILGNVAGCGAAQIERLLAPTTAPAILGCLRQCLLASHRGIQKEAAWAISNLASSSQRHHLELVRDACLGDLCTLLRESQFDIKKEAAYAVSNLCAANKGDVQLTEHVVSLGVLPAMLSLIRAPDMSAAELGLQFVELVLRCVPGGVKMVEELDGIDAIEHLFFSPSERLRVRSPPPIMCVHLCLCISEL